MTETERADGYNHLLIDLRGRIHGRDKTLSRFVKTAYDAANTLPDSFEKKVILERLTDVYISLETVIE